MGHGVLSNPSEKRDQRDTDRQLQLDYGACAVERRATTAAESQLVEPGPSRATPTPSARRAPRRRSIRVARATRGERERALVRARDLEQGVERPRQREDCAGGPRPCPYVACRHHLYLDVSPATGTIKLNFPELEVWELSESCALDVADSGAQEVDHAGHLLNVTRERIRQIEVVALSKLSMTRDLRSLRDVDDFPRPPRAR